MPSIISHAVFASGLGAAGSPGARMPVRYWVPWSQNWAFRVSGSTFRQKTSRSFS